MALFIFFTVIFVIVLFTFYNSCHYSFIVFVLFMAWFNVPFSFYYSCHYSCIMFVFVSLYKAYESIILGRHGKICGPGRVGSIESRVNRLAGPAGLTHIFQNKYFFFFQLQKQINDNMFGENE